MKSSERVGSRKHKEKGEKREKSEGVRERNKGKMVAASLCLLFFWESLGLSWFFYRFLTEEEIKKECGNVRNASENTLNQLKFPLKTTYHNTFSTESSFLFYVLVSVSMDFHPFSFVFWAWNELRKCREELEERKPKKNSNCQPKIPLKRACLKKKPEKNYCSSRFWAFSILFLRSFGLKPK